MTDTNVSDPSAPIPDDETTAIVDELTADPAPAEGVPAPVDVVEQYDPGEHPVDGKEGVLAYLSKLDDDAERLRIVRAEQQGKARRGIIAPYEDALAADDAEHADAVDPSDDDAPDAPADAFPAPRGSTREGVLPRRDADPEGPGAARPVWNVLTHGRPSPAQRERYDVVGE